jgi:hypothetical protein
MSSFNANSMPLSIQSSINHQSNHQCQKSILQSIYVVDWFNHGIGHWIGMPLIDCQWLIDCHWNWHWSQCYVSLMHCHTKMRHIKVPLLCRGTSKQCHWVQKSCAIHITAMCNLMSTAICLLLCVRYMSVLWLSCDTAISHCDVTIIISIIISHYALSIVLLRRGMATQSKLKLVNSKHVSKACRDAST